MEKSELKTSEGTFDILKCKADEILFVRYDSELDASETSITLEGILQYCRDNGMDCLMFPKSDSQVDISLEQMDVESLRRLENKIHEYVQKKSKIILT